MTEQRTPRQETSRQRKARRDAASADHSAGLDLNRNVHPTFGENLLAALRGQNLKDVKNADHVVGVLVARETPPKPETTTKE